ncbi:hypothetical protein QWI17_20045 [Gilvimarinus sp. SDUM040013]|uniref:Metallo-beta-lactamase domain-containing protein n=1 Tax=Gilvimarinus gilvus TaxID=3058038 RepID=A0ABU4S1E2_9GAMM|nr:hypothetical protein [Gilvimarinus sp. SDUM040013]MDO3388148.1 hypothetical protein [Gilvimarinus sp. SDUM040013]MDX6850277.1 hypothetical protein [Gilvimarinus sp. SDUM040013]
MFRGLLFVGFIPIIVGLSACTSSPTETVFNGVIDDKRDDQIRIHFLNSGAGSCQLIECADSKSVLMFDCGSSSSVGAMSKVQVADYIRDIVKNKEVRFAVSHPDIDHYNYLPYVFDKKKVTNTSFQSLVLGLSRFDYNTNFQNWMNNNFGIHDIYDDYVIDPNYSTPKGKEREEPLSCPGINTRVLIANAATINDPNAASMVLLLEGDRMVQSIYLPGDATNRTYRAMLGRGTFPEDVTVAAMAHHGAVTKDSNSSGLVNRIKPYIVVSQTGTKYGHPICSVVDTYKSYTKTTGGNIKEAQKHILQCDKVSGGTRTDSKSMSFAIYDTWSNGTVVIALEGDEEAVTCLTNDLAGLSTTCALK